MVPSPPPFSPRSADEHKARWPAALVRLWDMGPGDPGAVPADRPGLHPEHLFDFHDGLRLLVSRDVYRAGVPILHVSASLDAAGPLARRLREAPDVTAAFHAAVIERVAAVGGPPVVFSFFSRGTVPHYFDRPFPEVFIPRQETPDGPR